MTFNVLISRDGQMAAFVALADGQVRAVACGVSRGSAHERRPH
ncbi:hypothetical protein [Pedococcus sp. 5OH_020]|nr:hypothetical protein [Pedococcus sp. 5OH_020]